MTDYKVNFDVGWFGTDNPATAVHETMPFVVQTDGKNKFVNIGIVSGFHGSHVAGIAAGNALFGGAMSGAAPGAKIVSLRACLFIAGCTAHALARGHDLRREAVQRRRHQHVDRRPARPQRRQQHPLRPSTTDLIETYNVQMFLSQGNNGPGVNTAGDPGVCGQRHGHGRLPHRRDDAGRLRPDRRRSTDNLHLFCSRGPREDGGFKPNAVAPGAAVSTTPLWQAGVRAAVHPAARLPAGERDVDGLAADRGSSAALLVSAAKTGRHPAPAGPAATGAD